MWRMQTPICSIPEAHTRSTNPKSTNQEIFSRTENVIKLWNWYIWALFQCSRPHRRERSQATRASRRRVPYTCRQWEFRKRSPPHKMRSTDSAGKEKKMSRDQHNKIILTGWIHERKSLRALSLREKFKDVFYRPARKASLRITYRVCVPPDGDAGNAESSIECTNGTRIRVNNDRFGALFRTSLSCFQSFWNCWIREKSSSTYKCHNLLITETHPFVVAHTPQEVLMGDELHFEWYIQYQ